MNFKLKSEFKPTGDQPQAIEALVQGFQEGNQFQTLLGVTGSGKTFAFLLPILSKLIENKQKKAIVVSPTRELAIQIMENVKLLTQNIKNASVESGEIAPAFKQKGGGVQVVLPCAVITLKALGFLANA